MELLSSLGIHWSSLVAQIINFGILVFVLTKLVYKPLLKSLEERASAVKKLQSDTEGAEKVLEEATLKQQEIISESRKKAEILVEEAKKSAENLKESILKEARQSAEKIVVDGHNKLIEEQKVFQANLKKDLVDLIALGIEKTVGKHLTKEATESLKNEALENVINSKK